MPRSIFDIVLDFATFFLAMHGAMNLTRHTPLERTLPAILVLTVGLVGLRWYDRRRQGAKDRRAG